MRMSGIYDDAQRWNRPIPLVAGYPGAMGSGGRNRFGRALVAAVALAVSVACGGSADDGSGADPVDSSVTTVGETSSATPCRPDPAVVPGTELLSVPVGEIERTVERVVPPSFDGSKRLPLVVDLHGFTSTIAQQNLFSNLPEEAAERGYLLLTPQAEPATVPVGDGSMESSYWNIYPELEENLAGVQDDVGFLTGLIDDAVSKLCADEDRVYLTGFSNGAGLATLMACELSGRVAAIAPVAGVNLAPDCGHLDPVSVIAFHGDADPLVTYEGGSAARRLVDSPPVESRVGQFAEEADCSPDPTVTEPFDDIVIRKWTGCVAGTEVELYTVRGGGHTWPGMLNYVDVAELAAGSDAVRLAEMAGVDLGTIAGHMTTNVEATSAMLDFFDAHQRA